MVIIKEKEPLQEKLEYADKQQFALLQKQIDTDLETKKMLTSPMNKIPQYYWLYWRDDKYRFIEDASLFTILKILTTFPNVKLLFSKIGRVFIGFLSYKESGTEIISMKIASFKDDTKKTNPGLAIDLINFLNKEISKRTKIEWIADKANIAAINQYDKLLKTSSFSWSKEEDKKREMWVYTITGNKCN